MNRRQLFQGQKNCQRVKKNCIHKRFKNIHKSVYIKTTKESEREIINELTNKRNNQPEKKKKKN